MQSFATSIAPMEGFTTFPMRLWLHMASRPKAATTPFLRATKVFPENHLPATFAPELFELRGVLPFDVTPQFMACEIDNFMRAVELLPHCDSGVVELNCGCPSPNAAGKNAGSGILSNPDVFGATIERLCELLGRGRLAVKMRVGIDSPDELGTLLKQVAHLPLARLTVHGRTRADKYRGHARWDKVQEAAAASATPTWASGDVFSAIALQNLQSIAPSAVGAMIGRGVLYNPWIFEELRSDNVVRVEAKTLLAALVCYALLQEVWLTVPSKLVARIDAGKIGGYCGTDFESWQNLSISLCHLIRLLPISIYDLARGSQIPISPVSYARLKLLWSYLRVSLPESFQTARLMKARSLSEFAAEFLLLAEGCSEESSAAAMAGPRLNLLFEVSRP